ncbi:MAG: hypothetical protein HY843_03780 [Bdellovibrio sp.]|nr:hypothetical protein [Bdellovibrio sp.]
MSFIVYEWLQSSLMVDNIFETEEGKSHGMLREITLGFKANLKSIVIAYFDPHVIPSLPTHERNGFESGLEFVFMSDIYLRVGYYQNSTIPYQSSRGQGFGAGIGWVAPRLSIDYGFSRALKPVQASAHTVGATVYF